MKKPKRLSNILSVLATAGLLLSYIAAAPAYTQASTPPYAVAGAIQIPDDYEPEPLDTSRLPAIKAQATGLKAVAIVGDVTGYLDAYRDDMERAVANLESHGVSVTKFYYGTTTFNWSDIVAAATGTHFLLYMGHGIYSGDIKTPTSVGGFYLGDGKFVSSDQIRTDLAGRVAGDCVVILSHACFAAGGSGTDPDDWPPQDEATRRVQLYAAPFTDIGMQAYYANNYYWSAAATVNHLLDDPDSRKNVGDIFKTVYPYRSSEFRDLSYPKAGYDLWLSGSTGKWDDAFAGIPSYVFSGDITPQLGGLPATLTFTYYMESNWLMGANRQITPQNIGSNTQLTWEASSDNSLFVVTPSSGATPSSLTVTPAGFDTTTVMTYTGSLTLSVTTPHGVAGSPHVIELTLRVLDGSPHKTFLPAITRNYSPPQPTQVPNDVYYSAEQWGLSKINAPLAWGASQGDNVLIAILDTGADFNHPDLVGKLQSDNDQDYVNNDAHAQDDDGHGTHVTGIAAASTNNTIGVAGLGWEAAVLPLKVLDNNGKGSLSDITTAIRYAVDQGARVINMSLGSSAGQGLACSDFPELVEALEYAYNQGVLTVVAAGNDNADAQDVVPANCPYVLTVAATTSQDQKASFSNHGEVVDVAAPGAGIYSTYLPETYTYKDGTSMATPFVSGLAALVWAKYPSYTPDQVAAAIMDNAKDLGDLTKYGCGRIDAGSTVITGALSSAPTCKLNALHAANTLQASTRKSEPPQPGSYVPGRIIVKLHPSQDTETLRVNGQMLQASPTQLQDVWVMSVPQGREWDTIKSLTQEETVAYAHLDYLVFAQ